MQIYNSTQRPQTCGSLAQQPSSRHHAHSALQLGPPSPALATDTSEGSGLAPPTASPSPPGVTWGLKWTVGTLQAGAGQEEGRAAEEQQSGAGLGGMVRICHTGTGTGPGHNILRACPLQKVYPQCRGEEKEKNKRSQLIL